MKNYIKNKLLSILEVNEEQIKIEIPPKDNMGDYSIQCANLRNDKMNNPTEIANFIKDNFNDNENKFRDIKVFDFQRCRCEYSGCTGKHAAVLRLRKSGGR